ncbi:MAG: phage portal protein [Hyphomonadaceae bacterium]
MMRLFRRRDEKSAAPMVALSDLGAAHWSATGALAREGFERNPVVYRCVRLISEAAASVPFRVRSKAGDQGDALAALIARPNPDQSGADLMEAFYGHLAITGDAFIEAVSLDEDVRELHALRPDRMRPLKGARGRLLGWEHRVGGEARAIARESDGFLPVLHLRLFHPTNDYEGHAPLEAASRAVDVHNAGGAWTKALIDNAARPSGALVYSGAQELTGEQLSELKQDLERAYQGAGNAGRPIVLQGGLDWKPMSLSPADMDFVEARNMAAREIALAFGVPPMLLGIPGDATYANYREANSAFWRLTVLPLVSRAARALSVWLEPRLAGVLAPDLETVPAFQEERAAQWARIETASFLSLAEKRKLAGLD